MQGAYGRHIQCVEDCGVPALAVRNPADLSRCGRLIIPGGESTAMIYLLKTSGFWDPLMEVLQAGMPVWGTCAGMILLAERVASYPDQDCLGLVEMTVSRNAYGPQIASEEVSLPLAEAAEVDRPDTRDFYCSPDLKKFLSSYLDVLHLPFIRAPQAESWSPKVRPLLYYSGAAVCLRQGNKLVSSFHPELSPDRAFHQYFLTL